ncbi:P-loop containing nucleoside triphosphate hydrolase protein [Aureobasidium sp. EXF-10727]|nr:P-loop containing nucleoside triphosphate hydrolase protein [Aureobasidium sp. EXF-10727]KAI4729730.1 P-loop containing nucleoside triphosphate hydrolase protein [Aureobasidium sp. EXF-10728]
MADVRVGDRKHLTTSSTMRTSPNIIITGTPGVGKTTHCEQLASSTGLTHLNVNKVVKERDCEDGFDDELNSVIVDEDKLLDAIEPDLEAGGQIIDWHACDMFPQSLIDLVVVVRCNSTILYDRLKGRGYSDKKLDENMDAEIMEVLLQEARDSYDEEIVVELQSDDLDQIDENLERIQTWIENWKKDHSEA